MSDEPEAKADQKDDPGIPGQAADRAADVADAAAIEGDDRGAATAAAATAPPRQRRRRARATGLLLDPPFGGFMKGAVLGFVLGVPAIAAATWLLDHLGFGRGEITYERAIAFAAIFAGLPTVLSAGGVGRAAAHANRQGGRIGLKASARTGAATFAVAGIGLILLACLPLGLLPDEPLRWLWIAAAGIIAGALPGLVIGLWAGYRETGEAT